MLRASQVSRRKDTDRRGQDQENLAWHSIPPASIAPAAQTESWEKSRDSQKLDQRDSLNVPRLVAAASLSRAWPGSRGPPGEAEEAGDIQGKEAGDIQDYFCWQKPGTYRIIFVGWRK
jgi:hypothetical protein